MQIERKISYTPNIPSLNSKAARRTIRSLIKCAGLVAAADLPPEVFFTVTFYFKNQWGFSMAQTHKGNISDYLDAFLEFRAQENPLNIDRWNMNIFWWNGTVLNNFFNLGNCYFRCLAHCWVEIASRLPADKIWQFQLAVGKRKCGVYCNMSFNFPIITWKPSFLLCQLSMPLLMQNLL